MNEAAMKFWNAYWGKADKPTNVEAFCFGDTPDELAAMVVSGDKTATCNALRLYELNNEPIPRVGEYNIILNKALDPVALIQLEKVEFIPYDEIDERFAIAEGDGSYENWDNIHTRYFTEALSQFNETFNRKILLVCQHFKVLSVRERL